MSASKFLFCTTILDVLHTSAPLKIQNAMKKIPNFANPNPLFLIRSTVLDALRVHVEVLDGEARLPRLVRER